MDLRGFWHYIGAAYSHQMGWNLEEKSLKQTSYNYLLCFQESRFWPCPCKVKTGDKDSCVLERSLKSTCAEREDPVCVCLRPWRESHGLCTGSKWTFRSWALFVWRLRPKKTWRTRRSFRTRLAKTSLSLRGRASDVCLPKGARGSPVLHFTWGPSNLFVFDIDHFVLDVMGTGPHGTSDLSTSSRSKYAAFSTVVHQAAFLRINGSDLLMVSLVNTN